VDWLRTAGSVQILKAEGTITEPVHTWTCWILSLFLSLAAEAQILRMFYVHTLSWTTHYCTAVPCSPKAWVDFYIMMGFIITSFLPYSTKYCCKFVLKYVFAPNTAIAVLSTTLSTQLQLQPTEYVCSAAHFWLQHLHGVIFSCKKASSLKINQVYVSQPRIPFQARKMSGAQHVLARGW